MSSPEAKTAMVSPPTSRAVRWPMESIPLARPLTITILVRAKSATISWAT